MNAIWHDLECGTYTEDLGFWRDLVAGHDGPVLDVGAGTGRTAISLARSGHTVFALDNDDELLEALRRRADGLAVVPVLADARDFTLPDRFGVIIVPMQTIQLLGGSTGRASFLARARAHLTPGGVLAIAIADELDLFEVGDDELGPLPDVREIDGIVYSSRATAVRERDGGFVLERLRETVTAAGELSRVENLIHLDAVDAPTLEAEGRAAGLRVLTRQVIPATDDYVASTVVMLGA